MLNFLNPILRENLFSWCRPYQNTSEETALHGRPHKSRIYSRNCFLYWPTHRIRNTVNTSSNSWPQHHTTTAQHHHTTTAQHRHTTTAPQSHTTTAPQSHTTTAPRHHSNTQAQYYSHTLPQHHSPTPPYLLRNYASISILVITDLPTYSNMFYTRGFFIIYSPLIKYDSEARGCNCTLKRNHMHNYF